MGATSSSSTPRDGGRSGGGVHVMYTASPRPPRVTPILYHTNHTKADNVTLHPAADGSTRITSPRILTSASAFAGTSPPRRRRSALVGSPSRTTSCALSLFQSLMVSSIDKVGSRVSSSYYSIRRYISRHCPRLKETPPPVSSPSHSLITSVTLSHHIRHTLSSHPSHSLITSVASSF